MRTIINEIDATVKAKTEDVWDLLKGGDDVNIWFPLIATCSLRGEGVGAKRVCTTGDGNTLTETIVRVDNDGRIFGYTVDNHDMPLPTTNIEGTIEVKDDGSRAKVTWTVTFELTQDLEESALCELQDAMKAMMQTGIEGLERVASGG